MSNPKNWALIVEGGGMKGAYSAGILDAFHWTEFDPFDLYVGVSAGTPNLSSFIVGLSDGKRFLDELEKGV